MATNPRDPCRVVSHEPATSSSSRPTPRRSPPLPGTTLPGSGSSAQPGVEGGRLPGYVVPTSGAGAGAGGPAIERQVISVDRRAPIWVVTIDGTDLHSVDMTGRVESIVVEEADDHIPVATVILHNDKKTLTDDALWKPMNRLSISTGYPTTGLASRGEFLLTSPGDIFEQNGEPKILLRCYGEQSLLSRTQERFVYEAMTDADMAREVAGRHGLTPVVDDTDFVHEHTAQLNITDWRFLMERATLHGFEVDVRHGELHFHAPRFEDSGIKLNYREGEKGQLGRLHVTPRPHHRGAEFRWTDYDPYAKVLIDVRSQEEPDPITAAAAGDTPGGPVHAKEMASVDGKQPVWFVTQEGHEWGEEPFQEQTEAWSQHSRWCVDAVGRCIGLEQLRAGKMLFITGTGHAGGWYRIVRAKHDLNGKGGYAVEFALKRAWEGARTGTSPVSASRSSSAGSRGGRPSVPSPRSGVVTIGG